MKQLTDLVGMTMAGILLLIPTAMFILATYVVLEGFYWSMQFFTQ